MKKLLTLLIISTLLFSCKTKQSLVKDTVKIENTKDSTNYFKEITFKDSTINIKGDSLVLNLQTDSTGKLIDQVIETKDIKVEVKNTNGKPTVNCYCKDLELKVKLQETIIKEFKGKSNTKVDKQIIIKEKVKEVKYIPRIAWIGLIIGAISVTIHTIKIINKFK